ncbi:MAG: type II secretion system major pseudopilin GspG [Sphingomonas sp.]|jgi:general secretion pathway protein G|nr:type II secretion system major pseudopilin GspG [Sphingomonas sp.]OQW48641.1 MAG: type II secretion system protein GspG [Proteobacteria bacterium SG_bin6]
MRKTMPKPKNRRRREGGFTLVELMVVIVIIGLLATIVVLNVLPSGDRARVEKARADIETIDQALELYKLHNFNYPTTTDGLNALLAPPASLTDPSRYQKGGYIKKLPKDPWGRDYLYAAPGQHGAYDIYTLGADGKQGGEGPDADIGNWPAESAAK